MKTAEFLMNLLSIELDVNYIKLIIVKTIEIVSQKALIEMSKYLESTKI